MLSATRAAAITAAIEKGELWRIDTKDQLCAQSMKDALCTKLDRMTPVDISWAWEQAEPEARTWLEQEDVQKIGWAIRIACA